MSYTAPTFATFVARFPAFVAVPQATVDAAIVRSARNVDMSWFEADYTEGRNLMTAHLLAVDGLGTSADAKAIASGAAGFKSIRSGALSLDRGDNVDMDGLGSTTYGRRFLALARLNRGGPRTTGDVTVSGAGWTPTIPSYWMPEP